MMRNSHSLVLATVGAVLVAALSGCGGSAAPTKSAKPDIEDVRRKLDYAKTQRLQRDYPSAEASLKSADESLLNGLKNARGPEESTLKSLRSDLATERAALEKAKVDNPVRDIPAPKPVASSYEDPGEKALKESEAQKKKEAENSLKAAEAMAKKRKEIEDIEKKSKSQPKKTDDDEPGPVASKPGEQKEGEEKAPPPPKGVDFFPAVTADSPALEVAKLEVKGNFAIAYFQIVNKGDKGRPIMATNIFFKDQNGQLIIPKESCVVTPYGAFNRNAKDLTDQASALTMGSHSIDGFGDARFVAIGEGNRAKDVRKVGILIGYTDGKDEIEGPAAGKPAPAPDILKLNKK